MCFPLVDLNARESDNQSEVNSPEHGHASDALPASADPSNVPAPFESQSLHPNETPAQANTILHGGAAGRFASRMMDNVQRHIAKVDAITITGTLTVSLELLEDDEGTFEGNKRRDHKAQTGRGPNGLLETKFLVAEDATAAKRRRDREGIEVPRMLSKVKELHDRIGGDDCASQLSMVMAHYSAC